MARIKKTKESLERKHLREFVNGVVGKDYATANAGLTNAVKEKLKARVNNILQEK